MTNNPASKQIAIRHSQFVRRYLLRQGCEFAQTADEIGLFEVATFLESLPDETTARVSSEDCPVPEQEYIANMLESSAMWLQGKSTTVWAEEFGHTALMQSYAKFLRDLRQKLGSVQETEINDAGVPQKLLEGVLGTLGDARVSGVVEGRNNNPDVAGSSPASSSSQNGRKDE